MSLITATKPTLNESNQVLAARQNHIHFQLHFPSCTFSRFQPNFQLKQSKNQQEYWGGGVGVDLCGCYGPYSADSIAVAFRMVECAQVRMCSLCSPKM